MFSIYPQTKILTSNSSHISNTNNSNKNNMKVVGVTVPSASKHSSEDMEIRVQTLKRKQKALKAELQDCMCKTTSYQVAFQEELDMRTRIEEKYESLRMRFEVRCLVLVIVICTS